jgi:hypothetical protein
MPEQFQCPSCGAPLDIPEDVGTTLRCPYCAASVVVPENMRSGRKRNGATIIQIERPVDQVPPLLAPDDPILEALRVGNKIEAIKLYRSRTGLGLKESKDTIDALAAGMTPQTGLKPAKQGNVRAGCILGAVILIAVLAVGGIILAVTLTTATYTVSEAVTAVQDAAATEAPLPSPTPGLAELLGTIGAEGDGAGKMKDARSIAQDPEGNIYAADYLPGRVQMFSSAGEFIAQWALADPKQPLSGIAALSGERVAVLTSRSIGIYDGRSGKLLIEWKDGNKSGYNDAWRMANGNLAVTRTSASDNDIIIFDDQGNILQRIEQAFTGQTGNSEMEMKVAADLSGNLYALGGFNRLVLKFDQGGKFVTRMGGEGSEPGQFTFPDDIAVDSAGRIYVSEGRDVTIFDPNGRLIGQFQAGGVASGMVINSKDELLVAARSQVLKYRITLK